MTREELLKELAKANEEIKCIEYKRKDKKTGELKTSYYAPVHERVTAFRKIWPHGLIKTKIVQDDGKRAVVEARVYDDQTFLIATGHAYEDKESSLVNQNSYLENCETSAVGRALGMLGLLGVNGEIASADEMAQVEAIWERKKQEELKAKALTPERVSAFRSYIEENHLNEEKILGYYGKKSLEEITEEEHREVFDSVEEAKKNKKGKKNENVEK